MTDAFPTTNACCFCGSAPAVAEGMPYFHFRACMNRHGRWAHRVCARCWWTLVVPISEFLHMKCLGCVNAWPRWYFPPSPRNCTEVEMVHLCKDD